MHMHMHMHAYAQAMSIHGHMAHTPSNQDVPPEVLPLREEGHSQQGVQVEALHEQPEETCHDAVLEENHHGLAAHLWGQNKIRMKLQEAGGADPSRCHHRPDTWRRPPKHLQPLVMPTDETKERLVSRFGFCRVPPQ